MEEYYIGLIKARGIGILAAFVFGFIFYQAANTICSKEDLVVDGYTYRVEKCVPKETRTIFK